MKATTLKKAGFSKTRLARINSVMQRYIDENKFAGILTMIARRGRLVHFEPFGLQDMAAHKPMAEDTIFRIYSMTKPITSVAVVTSPPRICSGEAYSGVRPLNPAAVVSVFSSWATGFAMPKASSALPMAEA